MASNSESARKGPSRDLEAARSSYADSNVELSIVAHNTRLGDDAEPLKESQELHAGDAGDYIKSLVFGGLDGIITTFAVVCTIAGADLSPDLVLVMGFANLVADGISMGLGDFLSEHAESEYIKQETRREAWEMENFPEGERREMVEIYQGHGFSEDDATTIIDLMSRHTKFFVNHMVVEELGLMPVDDDDSPAKKGAVTFGAFAVFGAVPLMSYTIFHGQDVDKETTFAIACVLTALTMFALGCVKSLLTQPKGTRSLKRMVHSGVLMLVNGSVAASAAYLVGWAMEEAIGAKEHD